jgi:flagellar biogenesis protein FliO
MSIRNPAWFFQPRIFPSALACFIVTTLRAQTTNTTTLSSLSDTGPSLVRVFGALVFVIGIFLAGVWLFRNWQRIALQNGRRPKLNILETRSLGGRQALYVVGFEQGRFLIASSPAGVSLLSHLPDAPAEETPSAGKSAPTFALTLAGLLKSK